MTPPLVGGFGTANSICGLTNNLVRLSCFLPRWLVNCSDLLLGYPLSFKLPIICQIDDKRLKFYVCFWDYVLEYSKFIACYRILLTKTFYIHKTTQVSESDNISQN